MSNAMKAPVLFRLRGGFMMLDEHGRARPEVRFVAVGHPAVRGQEHKLEAIADPWSLPAEALAGDALLGRLPAVPQAKTPSK